MAGLGHVGNAGLDVVCQSEWSADSTGQTGYGNAWLETECRSGNVAGDHLHFGGDGDPAMVVAVLMRPGIKDLFEANRGKRTDSWRPWW